MRRYDRAYRVVKAAMDDGSIGEPLLAHMVHRNASVPDTFTSDMAMTDSVIHEIDTIRWLFGQEVVAATVVASRPSPRVAAGLRDPQLVLFELTDGAVVNVEVFVNCQYGYDVRCEVVGSEGSVSMDNPSTNSLLRGGRRAESVPPDWRVRFDLAYLEEMQEWVDGLRAGVVGGPSSWDGYAAAVVANCAVHSLAEGSRVLVEQVDRPDLYR
jgi:myo-inositol 2-dehydrogenase/D-chiro-inositol 1-dehydrogenase